jgi:hypothetical protein
MVAESRFDFSNAAISIFLHEVGKFYDEARGLNSFEPTLEQTMTVLERFSFRCCFCSSPVSTSGVAWDYLIPVNKSSLGLHAWGNVVPCCESCCSARRQQQTWREFLKLRCDTTDFSARADLIESFAATTMYDLNLNLHVFADTLYEDIGAVVMTLLQLRYKQAEQKIRALLAGESTKRSDTDRRANGRAK